MIAPGNHSRNLKMQMFSELVQPRFVTISGIPSMSSWTRIRNLPKQLQLKILDIYKPPIPIEVRKALTHWIDRRNWDKLDLDRVEHKNISQEIFDELCAIIEKKLLSSWGLADRERLDEAFGTFKTRYTHNPTSLICLLRKYILEEQEIIETFEKSRLGDIAKSVAEFLRDCAFLQKDSKVLEQQLKHLSELYHETRNHARESRELQEILEGYIAANQSEEILEYVRKTLENVVIELERRKEELENSYEDFLECFHSRLEMLAKLQRCFTDDIVGIWTRNRRNMANGLPASIHNLDIVKRCFERIEILPRTHSALLYLVGILLRGTPDLNEVLLSWKLPMLSQLFRLLMVKLMGRSSVFEEQPQQVVLNGGKVTCRIRYFFGLNETHIVLRKMAGCLVSESELNSSAHTEAADKTPEVERWKQPENLEKTADKGSVASFEFKLDSVNDRSCGRPAMAQKCRLLFETTFFILDKEITVKTASSSFVVIQHESDRIFAEATVFWDDLHLNASRKSFEVGDRVPWLEMAEALATKFHAETGMYLSETQLQYLGSKALRKPSSEPIEDEQLTWTHFCEDPLPERTFTFWSWFRASMILTCNHLKHFAMTGLLEGFIEMSDAEKIISNEQRGSFLLRFSDSYLGAVSILSVDEVLGRRVLIDQTLSTQDLEMSPLTERLRNAKELLYFYPDIPKDNIVPCFQSEKKNRIQHNPRKRRCLGRWQE